MRVFLLVAAVLASVCAQAQQQQQQPIKGQYTEGNRYYIACPKAYQHVPCPNCAKGWKNLCGDIPGLTQTDINQAPSDNRLCSDQNESASDKYNHAQIKVHTWHQRASTALQQLSGISSLMRTQGSPYQPSYPPNAQALMDAADFIDHQAIAKNIGPLNDRLAGVDACVSASHMGNDGCYHVVCQNLDMLDRDIYNFPQAIQAVIAAQPMWNAASQQGLPLHQWVGQAPNVHDLCADASPPVPCLSQMSTADQAIDNAEQTIYTQATGPVAGTASNHP